MPNTTSTIVIEKSHLLLVEGNDDRRFFGALADDLGVHDDLQVICANGKTNIRSRLRAIQNTRRSPGELKVQSLGIVRDADTNPNTAFQSVCDALSAVGFPRPVQPNLPAGTNPKTAVMILPHIDSCGALEDLCLEVVSDEDALACVNEYFSCLGARGVPATRYLSKARVHVFLSSKEKPDKRLGEAAEAGYWPWHSPVFDEARRFVSELVE